MWKQRFSCILLCGLQYMLPGMRRQLQAQQAVVLSPDSIIQHIEKNNSILQAYTLNALASRYSAVAATAWKPPQVGAGAFMIPYSARLVYNDMDLGSWAFQVEQEIPAAARMRAAKRYLSSLGDKQLAARAVKLNSLKATAIRLYNTWVIAGKRISLLQQYERILTMMKKIAMARYPYQQSVLTAIFVVEVNIENTRNKILAQQTVIKKARSQLAALCGLPTEAMPEIDTCFSPVFAPAGTDIASLAITHKQVGYLDACLHSLQLDKENIKRGKNPVFKIQLGQLFPLSPLMPNSFSAMGKISIPLAPWSSRRNSSMTKALNQELYLVQAQRAALLEQMPAFLYGLQYQIRLQQQLVGNTEKKIIPALQQVFEMNLIQYQENKAALTVALNSWEGVYLMQDKLLDDQLKLYQLIAAYNEQLCR